MKTVFGNDDPSGEGHEGLHYVYSDRLKEWDYSADRRARVTADNSGALRKTAAWYDAYLSAYFGKPCEVRHIAAGVNRSNGFPVAVFGYIEIAPKDSQ